MTDVVDAPEARRFELTVDDLLAELIYRVQGGYLVLIHTEVPEELGGRGIGGQLVRAAIARAARDDLTIVPFCPFVRRWFAEHPGEAGDVAVEWDLGRA